MTLDVSTRKLVGRRSIVQAAQRTGAKIILEEHSVFGGSGSAASEVVVKEYSVPIISIGAGGQYGASMSHEELLSRHGLTVPRIVAATPTPGRKTR